MSLWDQFPRFKAADAAELAIPNNASEAKALLTKMKKGYEKARGEVFLKHYETGHPELLQSHAQIKYQTLETPLPAEHLYSWALEVQAKVLFRPDISAASCACFHDWYTNETGVEDAFSSNFDAQEFSREELDRWLGFQKIKSAYKFKTDDASTKGEQPTRQVLDRKLLATPEELLKAFGAWGLQKNWFRCLSNHRWLLQARMHAGIGGNRPKSPLFCPKLVMVGLATQTKPRRGSRRRISIEKGWKQLNAHFPLVYQANADEALVDDQGLKYW